jgi:hypothetical protein
MDREVKEILDELAICNVTKIENDRRIEVLERELIVYAADRRLFDCLVLNKRKFLTLVRSR